MSKQKSKTLVVQLVRLVSPQHQPPQPQLYGFKAQWGGLSSTSLSEKLPESMRLTSKQAHAVRKETAIDAAKEAVPQGDGIYKKMTG
eukprot:scaffold36297_cov63-Attheya_sp.AAC.2